MALFQIGNDKITIQIDSMGAELKSLKRVDTGTEYMWEGDPAYWKRTSPVLFPLVGGLKDGIKTANIFMRAAAVSWRNTDLPEICSLR